MIRFKWLSILVVLGISCNTSQRKLEGDKAKGEHIPYTVTAKVETEPVSRNPEDDAADDPAIWYNKNNPEQSVIYGTDKKGGLAAYNLKGKLIEFYNIGRTNNVDVKYNFPLVNDTVDIVACSNRENHNISIASIDKKTGKLKFINDSSMKSKLTGELYGFCLYHSKDSNRFYAMVNSKEGEVEQWLLQATENGSIGGNIVRSFHIGGQTEGMVADDVNATLYIGEEEKGIWKFDAEPVKSDSGILIESTVIANHSNLEADIEGIDIYPTDSLNGYLLVSSQGNFTYALFERQGDNAYIGSFRIIDGVIDGVEETDGLAVSPMNFGSDFTEGILVVQDGYNFDDGLHSAQNFKIISWKDLVMEIEKMQ